MLHKAKSDIMTHKIAAAMFAISLWAVIACRAQCEKQIVRGGPYETRSLSGSVLYTNTGEPIAGMTFELYRRGQSKALATQKTDSNGRFHFSHTGTGEYFMILRKKGYTTTRNLISVKRTAREPLSLITEACGQ